MKKLLLFLLCISFLYTLTDAQTVQRRVMVEEFSNASCPPCEVQNPAFDALMEANHDKVTLLKYQVWWPGFDPMYEQNPTEVTDLVNYYGVDGVPNAQVDGTDLGIAANVNQGTINNRYAVPSPLGMELTHEVSPDFSMVSIHCTVTNPDTLNAFNVADAMLRVAIIEQEIVFPEPPGTTAEFHFIHVMRKMVPNSNGTALGEIPAGGSVNFDWDVPLPNYFYSLAQIGVVAFVQENTSRVIHQSQLSDPVPLVGDYPDASFASNTTGPAGLCDYSLSPSAVVGNEGDIEITSFDASYSVNGTVGQTINWTGNLIPGDDVIINFTPTTVPPGESVLEYTLGNINNGAIDINSLNHQVPAESFFTLQQTPIGSSIETGFENEAALDNPMNTIVDKDDDRDLTVVNQGWFQGIGAPTNGPVGGYGQSNQSVMAGFWWTPPGTMTTMTYEKFDLSAQTNDSLTFDVAYRQYTTENDRLRVQMSTDCGLTWTTVYNKSGSTLATVGASQNFFTPGAGDWRSEAVDLTAYDGASEVVMRFVVNAAFGNNLYIDNINLYQGQVSALEDVIAEGNMAVFPNPASDVVNVDFELEKANLISVRVFDVIGKLVETLVDNVQFNSGAYSVSWDSSENSGVFLIRIQTEEGEITKRITVVK